MPIKPLYKSWNRSPQQHNYIVFLLMLCLQMLLVFRSSWKAFWKPAACCVAPSEALMLEMKVLIFLLVSLVAGESRLL